MVQRPIIAETPNPDAIMTNRQISARVTMTLTSAPLSAEVLKIIFA